MDELTFWSRVDRGEANDCWLWQGATNPAGYGVIHEKKGEQKMVKAHRRAYTLSRGPIPAGMYVLHRCDNPPCCNPTHLWIGDHLANMRDMFAKGRRTAAVGNANGRSRLTAEQVRELRASYRGRRGELKAAIEHYGVAKNTLLAVLRGDTWRHVT